MTEFAGLSALVAAGADLDALETWLGKVRVDSEADLQGMDRSRGCRSRDLLCDSGVGFSLFMLPVGQAIPLHDHPRMRGLLRVVRGQLCVRSFAWEDEGGRVARREPAARVGPDSPILRVTPSAGALHRLEAEEDSVFLDLFVPPYGAGRVCSYYREAEELGGGRCRLERL